MGHTDVVPVTPEGWRRDPFGGELVDGEVWGRGAIDMLNLTASMAVAFRHLARSGLPAARATCSSSRVADEEAGGRLGAEWMLDHHGDAVGADYVLTESGGFRDRRRRRCMLTAGEKGLAWRRLVVTGTPGHGSMPFGTDNALVKAAEVVRRIARLPPRSPDSTSCGRRTRPPLRPARRRARRPAPTRAGVGRRCSGCEHPRPAKRLHACTHTTFSPNVVHGGQKTNTIPDRVEIDVDIRTLPGEDGDDVDAPPRATRSATSTTRWRSCPSSARRDDDAPRTRRCGTASASSRQAVYPEATLVPAHDHRRHRRPLLPGEGRGGLRRRPVQRRRCTSSGSPTASTATTSGSTSSRSRSHRPLARRRRHVLGPRLRSRELRHARCAARAARSPAA